MRIAYVNLHWPRPITSGVGRKMDMQLRLWREMGHTAQLFMHMHPYHHDDRLVAGEPYVYSIQGRFATEVNRSKALLHLLRDVRAWQPDVIYLRYGMYVFPLERLSQIAPVVVEINTNDVYEHERLGGLLAGYNRLTRGITLRMAAGLVAVSGEFVTDPHFARFEKPSVVVANGIEIDQIAPLPAPGNPTPRLLFVGSPGYRWHGLDHLVRLAQWHPEIEIDIVGYDALPEGLAATPNLHLHGYLTGAAYMQRLASADAAIGPLAWYHNGIHEGSPLKMSEYLAYGLPVITPYDDTNLAGLEVPWLLRIPNAPDSMDAHHQQVADFVHAMRGLRVDRAVVAPRIDARLKERDRLAFMATFLPR
jgi:glycosyltransferase involved in cell wall biosynthesis